MPKRGGDDALKLVGAVILGALFIYLVSGRGKNNSFWLPDAVEDRVDLLVESLNRTFGKRWVDQGLNALQAHIESTMPQFAVLVKAVYWAEQQYQYSSNAGIAKKAAALRVA